MYNSWRFFLKKKRSKWKNSGERHFKWRETENRETFVRMRDEKERKGEKHC